jgi:hypothetical protein
MKFLLLFPLFVLFLFSSCKDKDDDEQQPTPATKVILEVMKQSKSSSGQVSLVPASAIIHMWVADNSDFDVAASPEIHVGSAFDKTSNSFKTMKYGAIGSRMSETIEPGRYFVYVLLPKSSGSGSLAYSYTYFEIKQGETLNLKKTFGSEVGSGQFESWEKNK